MTVRRQEILTHFFGNVGEMVDDFSCAIEATILLHGRLFISTKFACFYSNLFGLEKKIRIPLSHINVLTKEQTAMVIPNAICIQTFKKSYIFRSFWDRNLCFDTLKRCIASGKNRLTASETTHIKEAKYEKTIYCCIYVCFNIYNKCICRWPLD